MPNPKIELNYDKLNALLQFKTTIEFAADYLEVSRDTLIRRIKEDHGMTFKEYSDLKRQRTATKLQQKAIEMALQGNTTMMIFALKNLAMWSDKQEIQQQVSAQVEPIEKYLKRIKKQKSEEDNGPSN